ncbi:MAG: hypothetical protein EOO53_12110 [Gammaproteobacteria bacterium]|nr:MAG: hypothetical protein EOO53_12110 [Gammaproteobacteria bacterium]
MMFKYLLAAEISWRDIFAGAVLASILFNLGNLLMGLYLGKSEISSTYGGPGS